MTIPCQKDTVTTFILFDQQTVGKDSPGKD